MLSVEALKKQYTIEQVLIILISRLYFKTEKRENIIAIIENETIDWKLFYQILSEHFIRSFIYHVIQKEAITLPAEFSEKLKKHAFLTGVNSLHQMNMLTKIIADLNKDEVLVIPYKGVTLAATYYESIAMRESSDIDLLVAEDKVEKIRAYFHEKQYVPKVDVPTTYLKYYVRTFKEISFKTPKDSLMVNCSVEVQWKLMVSYTGAFEGFHFFAPHVEKHQYQGQEVLRLKPTYDFLCIASNHLIKESLMSFKYLIDMACIIQKNGGALDGLVISNTIKKFFYVDVFYAGLATIYDILGVQLNRDNWPSIATKKNNQILLDTAIGFLKSRPKSGSVFKTISSLLKYDVIPYFWFKRIGKILFYFLMPGNKDINTFKFPTILLPILFLLRPFMLLYRLAKRRF